MGRYSTDCRWIRLSCLTEISYEKLPINPTCLPGNAEELIRPDIALTNNLLSLSKLSLIGNFQVTQND